MLRFEAWTCQNGEATVTPLNELLLNPNALEKAMLFRPDAPEKAAWFAAAEPVSANSPPAQAAVTVKIAAPVRIIVWRAFAMLDTP